MWQCRSESGLSYLLMIVNSVNGILWAWGQWSSAHRLWPDVPASCMHENGTGFTMLTDLQTHRLTDLQEENALHLLMVLSMFGKCKQNFVCVYRKTPQSPSKCCSADCIWSRYVSLKDMQMNSTEIQKQPQRDTKNPYRHGKAQINTKHPQRNLNWTYKDTHNSKNMQKDMQKLSSNDHKNTRITGEEKQSQIVENVLYF